MKRANNLLTTLRNNRGATLLLVLWVLVLMTIMVTEFAYSIKTEISSTRNFKEDTEAYYAALAGLELAKAELLAAHDKMYLDKDGLLVFGDKVPQRNGKVGASSYSYEIIDEDRKLNINSATPDQIRYVLGDTGIEDADLDTIMDSLLDWKDADDLHRMNGAEEEYYRSLATPYSCKDSPFDSVEELVLVKGIKPEMVYGSKDGKYKGLLQYLTAKSSGMVNINTADRLVLETRFGPAAAENIVAQRSAGPILLPLAGGAVRSSHFTIIATGTNGKIVRTVKAIVVKRSETSLETLYWNDAVAGQEQRRLKKEDMSGDRNA